MQPRQLSMKDWQLESGREMVVIFLIFLTREKNQFFNLATLFFLSLPRIGVCPLAEHDADLCQDPNGQDNYP